MTLKFIAFAIMCSFSCWARGVEIYSVTSEVFKVSKYSVEDFIDTDEKVIRLKVYKPLQKLADFEEANFPKEEKFINASGGELNPFVGEGDMLLINFNENKWYLVLLAKKGEKEYLGCVYVGKMIDVGGGNLLGSPFDGQICEKEVSKRLVDIVIAGKDKKK